MPAADESAELLLVFFELHHCQVPNPPKEDKERNHKQEKHWEDDIEWNREEKKAIALFTSVAFRNEVFSAFPVIVQVVHGSSLHKVVYQIFYLNAGLINWLGGLSGLYADIIHILMWGQGTKSGRQQE